MSKLRKGSTIYTALCQDEEPGLQQSVQKRVNYKRKHRSKSSSTCDKEQDNYEKLKQYNEKLLYENVTLFNERNLARKAKRELVEALEGLLWELRYADMSDSIKAPFKAAVAKHKENLNANK